MMDYGLLPTFFALSLAVVVLIYVALDGFDLGVGIISPLASDTATRQRLVDSIAPFWDGNETWLVLAVGGLFAFFPLAFSIILPALYYPFLLLILSLVLRGVGLELQYVSKGKAQAIWLMVFHYGSLLAAFLQGAIIGSLSSGIDINGTVYAGGAWNWLTPYSILCGIATVIAYGLLGATWSVLRQTDQAQIWARAMARRFSILGIVAVILVIFFGVMVNQGLAAKWAMMSGKIVVLAIAALLIVILVAVTVVNKRHQHSVLQEFLPFLMVVVAAAMCVGLIVYSFWPWVVPFTVSIADATGAQRSNKLLLPVVLIMVPIVIAYFVFCFFVFRGKITHALEH